MTVAGPTTESPRCSLIPPNILSLIGDNECFRPSEEQEKIVLEASRAYWYHVASIAYASLDHGLASEFTNPRYSLQRVPKSPDGLKSTVEHRYCYSPDDSLCHQVPSTWTLGDSDCEAAKKEMIRPVMMQIGVRHPTPYSFDGKVFNHWVGTGSEQETGFNYLGVLAICWCYILSAQLLEMQGGSVDMHYTDSRASVFNENAESSAEETQLVDVGDADDRTMRWWSAILAKGTGWKAILTKKFGTAWMVSRTCATSFVIKKRCNLIYSGGVPALSNDHEPLSSDDAFTALLDFASFHNLGSQVPIALATALSFPMHQYYYGSHAKLPAPSAHGARISKAPLDTTPMWKELKSDLPYYITLSCTSEVMLSTLCGSFWQSDVPSNMATQWLHPISEEVLRDAPDGKAQELLASISAIRQPNAGALWIGAVISGMGPRLLKNINNGDPPLNPIAFPWTGVPQSFLDYAGSGPYTWTTSESKDSKYISRRDVWRLLNLPPTEQDDDLDYNFQLTSPWEPFGTSLTKDCALRVASHFNCTRHAYRYEYITWELANGENVRDYGLRNDSPSILTDHSVISHRKCTCVSQKFEKKELDPYRDTSEITSLALFRWFIIGEGAVPMESLYRDDNIRDMWEQTLGVGDEGEELDQSDRQASQELETKRKEKVESWLDAID